MLKIYNQSNMFTTSSKLLLNLNLSLYWIFFSLSSSKHNYFKIYFWPNLTEFIDEMPPTYLNASGITQSTKIKRSQVRLTAWVISYFKEKNLWGVCNRRFVFLGPGSEIPGSRETQQRGLLQRLHLLEGEEPDAPRLRRLHKTFSDSFRKRKRLIRTIILWLNFASSMFLFVVICVKKNIWKYY